MNKVKILKDFSLQKSLTNVHSTSWNKIAVYDSWRGRIAQAFHSAQLMLKGNNFASEDSYNDFQKFMDSNLTLRTNRGTILIRNIKLNDAILSSWEDICDAFRISQKVLGRNGNVNSFQNQEAYEFLKKYLGSQWLTIKYSIGNEFNWEEFDNDKVILNDQVKLIKNKELNEIIISKIEELKIKSSELEHIIYDALEIDNYN